MSAKILVVDDSPIVFKMVKRALEPGGFEIVGHAENGKIALEMYDTLKPDVLTLDVTMPVMDGLETAKNLFEKNPNVKVIMLSAMGDDDLIEQAQKIGIQHFHSKPVQADKLIEQVQLLLNS
jgi:two-component system, chemotaxis family, chemotaxis protein CheY